MDRRILRSGPPEVVDYAPIGNRADPAYLDIAAFQMAIASQTEQATAVAAREKKVNRAAAMRTKKESEKEKRYREIRECVRKHWRANNLNSLTYARQLAQEELQRKHRKNRRGYGKTAIIEATKKRQK